MSEWSQLQQQFQDFLLHGTDTIAHSIVATPDVAVATRLAIYQDAYVFRLIDGLQANFPSLYLYLGTEEFERLARAYIAKYPSTYRSIRWFGDALAVFIKNYYPEDPYLTELTDFEWKMTLAFDAADAPRVQIEAMPALPADSWATLQFRLHPSVQRMHFQFPTVALWQALTHDEPLPDCQKNANNAWVLWRNTEYLIPFYSLSNAEAWALDAIDQEISFASLCEGLCQWIEPDEVGLHAASYLKGWIQKGLLSQIIHS